MFFTFGLSIIIYLSVSGVCVVDSESIISCPIQSQKFEKNPPHPQPPFPSLLSAKDGADLPTK